jgi:hypothetical protein
MQNVPLAMAIILISFPGEIQAEVLVVPIFYGIAIALWDRYRTVGCTRSMAVTVS